METTSVGYYIVGKYVQVFIKEHGLVTGLVNEYIPLVETYELVFDFGTTYMKLEPPVYVLNGPVVTKMYDTDSDDELQAAAGRLLAQPAEDGWIKPTEALLAAKEQSPFFWPSAGAGKLSVADEDGWFQPNIFLQRERQRPSIKDGGDVVVQVPGKAALVRGILESSEDEDEDVEELVEKVQTMKKPALRAACTKHELWSSELVQARATVPEMKEALVRFLKTGEKGAKSEHTQKAEETSKATAAFFQLASVVAITSTISNFNPKNKDHAECFMKQYRKKHGKGPANRCDAVSINGQLWNMSLYSRCGLLLERAKERRADMTSEKRQGVRDAFNKYHHEVTKPKRAREGKPLRNAGAGSPKASAAMDWEVNKICQEMCNEGDDDLAFDLYWGVAGAPSIDPKERTFGCRDALFAAMALLLVTAYALNLGLAIVDGEGPTIGDIAMFYEIGGCWGYFQDGMESVVTDLLSSRYLPKTPHFFDGGRTYNFRTPLADNRAGELGGFFSQLGAWLAKGGSILGFWGGGDGKFIDAHHHSNATVLNLLLVMRFILGLELNGAVPVGHPLYLCRDGISLSTDLIGRVFCPKLAQSENFKPHFGDYDAVVTRIFVCGVLAARQRALKNPSRKLIWKGKELDVVALRAAWESSKYSDYKTKRRNKRRRT